MVGRRQRMAIFGSHNSELSRCNTISKRRWSISELSTLKREFRMGTPLKVIARMLGRTESATNKVLSRKGIRYDFTSVTHPPQLPSIVQVISYLEQKDYKITPVTQVCQKYNGKCIEIHTYKINSVPVSCTQLLIIANKLRIEEGLPIFEYDVNNL